MAQHARLTALWFTALFCANAAYGAPECKPTASVAAQNYPGAAKIPTSNNLLLPTGKAVEAEGQKLILRGRVVDSHCIPVADAVVELWQSNPFGRWLLAEPRDVATPNATFAGAGRTYTNSNGEFTFITAFPAPVGKRAPFVNIKIMAEGMKDMSTALFFRDDARNGADEAYKKLAPAARDGATITVQPVEDDSNSLTGAVDIVLGGKAPFRTY